MRRWVLYIAFISLVLSALGWGVVALFHRWRIQPALNSRIAIQEKHLALYLDDVDFLDRNFLLKGAKNGKADAGPFLNAKLYWLPNFLGAPGATKPVVPHQTREEILRLGQDWIKKYGRIKRMPNVDLAFMAGLSEYDFWDIESNSPIDTLMKQNVFVPPPRLPVPEVSDLLIASKLRLMRGALEGEPRKALEDVRNFARLLSTTENMQLVLAAVSMLEDERKAYRFFVDDLGMDANAWTPVDRNLTRRAQRAILATRGYLRLWTKEETFKKVFMRASLPVGLCAAANEAYPLEYALRPVLGAHWPFEIDLRPGYQRLDDALGRVRSNCRIRYLDNRIEEDGFAVKIPGPYFLNRLPYARKIFGLRASIASFGGFDAYNALTSMGPLAQ